MRIRTIKPSFWTNEKMSSLPDFARLLAIGLLNYADDHGYFWANSLMIRGALFPFEEDSTKVLKGLAQLSAEGYLRMGRTPDGREVGHVVNFNKHQRVDKATASDIEPLATFEDHSSNTIGLFGDDSTLYGIGKDRKVYIPPEPTGPTGNGHEEKPEPAKRERDPLFDELAKAEGSDPLQLTRSAARTIGVKLAEIRRACPLIQVGEITKRASAYRKIMPGMTLTASALVAHWAKCDVNGGSVHAHADIYTAIPGWREKAAAMWPDFHMPEKWEELMPYMRSDLISKR